MRLFKKRYTIPESIKKLDKLLNCITFDEKARRGAKRDELMHWLKPSFKDYLDFEYHIKKLEDDNKIVKGTWSNENGLQGAFYSRNMEGEIFALSGGYEGLIEKEISRRKNQSLKDWLLIVGSWLAGIGAILYFALEVYKFLCK